MVVRVVLGWGSRVFWMLPVAVAMAAIAHESSYAGRATDSIGARQASTSRTPKTEFPLRVVPGKRHLVDQAGTPFLLVGDTAWSLVVQLKEEGVDRYLDDRQRRGYNAILVNLIEHKFATSPPLNAHGQGPFTKPGDFGSPNEAYFAHVDMIVRKAHARGILVLLVPAYPGANGGSEGWWSKMKANGAEKLRAYGRFVGTRYRRFPNVLWVQGGDFDPPAEDRALVDAVADGIRSVDDKLHTFHGARGTSALAFWRPRPAWLGVNTIYTSHDDVVAKARIEYERSSTPFFLIEARYENTGYTAATVRQQAYQALLAGSSGSIVGNKPIWSFSSDWERDLGSPGVVGKAQLARLFRSFRWWKLRPAGSDNLLVRGIGEGSAEAVAARATDGTFALVYSPTPRRLTLDLSRMRGQRVKARWYDPTTGRYRPVAGSPFRAGARLSVTTPARNARGDGDMVLVLETLRTGPSTRR